MPLTECMYVISLAVILANREFVGKTTRMSFSERNFQCLKFFRDNDSCKTINEFYESIPRIKTRTLMKLNYTMGEKIKHYDTLKAPATF